MDLSRLLGSIGASPQSEMDLNQGVSKEANIPEPKSKGSFESRLSKASEREDVPVAKKEPQSKAKPNDDAPEKDVKKKVDDTAVSKDAQAKSNAQDEQSPVKAESADHASKAKDADVTQSSIASKDPELEIADLTKGLDPEVLALVQQQAELQNLELKPQQIENLLAKLQEKIPVDKLPQLKELGAKLQELQAQLQKSDQGLDAGKKLHESLKDIFEKIKALPEIKQELAAQPALKKAVQQLQAQSPNLDNVQKLQKDLKDGQKGISELKVPSSALKTADASKQIESEALLKKMGLEVQPKAVSKAEVEKALNAEQKASFKEGVAYKPASFKQLVDGLFVQKGLQGQVQGPGQSIVSGGNAQFSISQEVPASQAASMRANLVEDMQAVMEKSMITKEGGSMKLSLRPGNMGNVRIEVNVDAGAVRINMQAEKAAAHSVLKNNMTDLKHQLASAGLKVDDIQINHSNKAENAQSEQRDNSGGKEQQQQNSPNKDEPRQEQHHQAQKFFSELDSELADERSVA